MASFDEKDPDKKEPPAKSDVRSRVARHMTRLLVPSIIGLNACGCTSVCDPLPPPDDGGATGPKDGGTEDASTPSDAGAVHDAGKDASIVCDPLPPPEDGGEPSDGGSDEDASQDAAVVCDPLPGP